jgi:hypothetical protein
MSLLLSQQLAAISAEGRRTRVVGPAMPFLASPRGYGAPSANVYSYAATGGLTFSGGSTQSRVKVVASPTGGLQLGGASAQARVVARSASGGVQTGGASAQLRVAARAPTGGLQLAGASAQARVAARALSGGLQLGGSGSPNRVEAFAASGGIVFGGSASASFFSNSALNYNATWRRTTAGPAMPFAATIRGYTQLPRSATISPSGGLAFGGNAAMTATNAALYSVNWGGRQMGPAMDFAPSPRGYTASTTQTYAYAASGGLLHGGSAAVVRKAIKPAAGGISISGVSSLATVAARSPAGGLNLAGAAGYSSSSGTQSFSYSASGGVSFGGLAPEIRVRVVVPSGGYSFAGNASYAGVPAGTLVAAMQRFNRQRSWRRFKSDAMVRR